MEKPRMGFWQIWNMSFGFLGIQMGFALQNANASRILSIFGADVHELGWFWLVAPVTGFIVQPIVGHYSDKTWTRLGRRRPFFLAGSILAALGLIFMPRADLFIHILPALWVGAGMLMIMDASFNIAMEPFRALVADNLNAKQRTQGFSIQTVLIGIGAVVGSWLPYFLTKVFSMSNEAPEGSVPLNVIISFSFGALILVGSILITVFTTREFSPEEMKALQWKKAEEQEPEGKSFFSHILSDIRNMPETMRQLSWVQFFSWFGLFGMWVYTTPAVAHHIYQLPVNDSSSVEYQNAGDWVGIIFGVYNLVSFLFAFALPRIAKKAGRKKTHSLALLIGALGLFSMYFVPNENWLILSMVAVGVAWASILAMPYAILAGSIPPLKMGVYMGIFNFFIVLPQILNGLIGGPMIKYLYGGNPVFALVVSGLSFVVAALLVGRVNDVDDVKK